MLPALACAGFGTRRLRIEDRFLHERLDGYEDYAAQVRYRLFPGVW